MTEKTTTHEAEEDARNEHILIYVNGRIVPRSQAVISVYDSGFMLGDGVWEGLRLYDGRWAFLDEHLDRLWQGAATIGMNIGMTREALVSAIWQTLHANKMHDHVHVRFMLTRGIKKTPSQDPRLTISGPNLVIIAEHKQANPTTKEKGITLFTSTIRRGSPDYLDPRLNCHSKLHEVMALVQALEAGADEALLVTTPEVAAIRDADRVIGLLNAQGIEGKRGGRWYASTVRYLIQRQTA